ncbi:MAG TPA: glycosyltransferase family 2 protein [Polyangiaceae bacterium]|nr:glycosyltransferase family 2 protein [Polyangiaceae bacterium]
MSVVVPTYKEAANIPTLLERLAAVRETHGLDMEVLIMDDNSRDGSVEEVQKFGAPWVKIVVRTENRGLSPAVTQGLYEATKEVVLVMDADLSHPPEKIPELLHELEGGADFVIGSRYTPGGSTNDDWGFLRWLNSRIATLLARPLTSAHDPMAGFFAMRRARLEGVTLNAIGYKIGLELIVKCNLVRVSEVPIHFLDRVRGESKLTLGEQLRYLQHLRRLYIHKFGGWSELVQFAVVGSSGIIVNLVVLRALVELGVSSNIAVAVAIGVSMISNFFLNRRFTFSHARGESIVMQFLGFTAACALGAVLNYVVTLWVKRAAPSLPLEVAALAGVAAGLILNFLTNRYLVFKRKHYRSQGAA